MSNKVKKPKADVVLVACKSIASNHQMSVRKGRQGSDKIEFLAFDPEIQREVCKAIYILNRVFFI